MSLSERELVTSLQASLQISENFDLKDYLIDAGFSSRIGHLAVPILLQFWTRNFDGAYPLLNLENTLLNGREAAV
jgi:hypothetical protein